MARSTLLGAVGFELLKQAMVICLSTVTSTPNGAVFGSLLGLLLFGYLVSRFILLITAWAATAHAPARADHPVTVPAPAPLNALSVTTSQHSGGAGHRTTAITVGITLAAGVLLGVRWRDSHPVRVDNATEPHQ